MRITKLLSAVAGAALMGVISQPAFAQGKGETLKIQDYPGVGNMLTRVAIAKDFCKARGITCQLQMIPTGPLGGAALLAKSIDVGFFPPEVQISAMLKGAQMKAVASWSPVAMFTIVVVRVIIGCVGSGGHAGVRPAASATIIVSPIARDIARMNAAPMPDIAAGSTTRRITSPRVAPSA